MILAADNLTAANPEVAAALERLDPKPLQDLAKRCEAAGARLLDLNPGYLSKTRQDRMGFMVEAVQAVSSLPLILDSPSAGVLARGLAACRTKPVLSALTLEENKLAEILPLAAAHGTDLVVLLLDERSFPPPTSERKIALALEIRERALAAGLTDRQMIFDPVVPNLSWPDAFRQTGEVIKTVRWLAGGQVFGEPARTMAGISNLRSGLRRQYPLELEVQLMAMLAGAGLEIALAEALRPEMTDALRFIRQMH
jgi:5-methyltetrahydrofolate corrinoid/iron sulfur protein methyltransferase